MYKIFIFYFFIWTSIFFIFRIFFIIYFWEQIANSNIIEILKVFLHGLRFDLSTQALLLFCFSILALIEPFNRFKWYLRFWKYSPLVIIIYSIGHLTGDFLYFQNANKHLGYEGFVFFGRDFWVVFSSTLVEDLGIVLLGFFLMGVFAFFCFWFLRKLEYKPNQIPLRKKLFFDILFILCLIILARGGFQKSFISTGNAIVTKNPLLNQFVLNGIFTTIIDFRVEKFPQIQSMNELEAIAITKEIINFNGSTFVNDAFPLLRQTRGKKDYGKPNILIIILESWPAKYSHENFSPVVDGKEITPRWNSLKKQGLYFPRFFANGGRTSNGLVAILTGMPDRPGISLIHTKYALNRFTPLGVLLKNIGYQTNFYYGGQLAFENITPILKNWGFENLYDYEFFDSQKKFKKGVWGFNDLDVYKQILYDLENSKNKEPWLTVCLTLSTHHPFQIPSKEFEILPPIDDENKFINSLHYADFALGEFISEFSKLNSFENTFIFIVSDHTSHRKLNYYEDRNIPFLIYSPKYISPNVSYKIGSQVDILPTVLSLIDAEFYFSSIGRNLFFNEKGHAYIAFGNIYGIAENEIMFLDTVDSFNGLNFPMSPPFVARKTCKEDPTPCILPHKKAKAILNATEFLLKKNLIAPPN